MLLTLTLDAAIAQLSTSVLAQVGPNGVVISPLPSAPAFERFVLIQPWPLVGVLALAGLAVAFAVRSRWRVALAGLLGALAGMVLAAGMMVTTDREKIAAATRALVDATARADIGALAPMLAADVRFVSELALPGVPGVGIGLDRDQLLKQVADKLGREWTLKEHSVLEVQSTLDGPSAGRTQVRVRVVPEATGFPNASWWRIDWRREGDGTWRVIGIRPLHVPMVG
ncbi:MAG: hypothetical protein ACKVW3_06075 [Phycisphaerales bacterium]